MLSSLPFFRTFCGFLYFSFFLLGGCGYRVMVQQNPYSVSLAPIKGGEKFLVGESGSFSQALSRVLRSSPFVHYHEEGDYVLEVEVVEMGREAIGYRSCLHTDTDATSRFSSGGEIRLHVDEKRALVTLLCRLVDVKKKEVVYSSTVDTGIDYDCLSGDHVEELTWVTSEEKRVLLTQFSRGEFVEEMEADRVTAPLLHEKIAEKVLLSLSPFFLSSPKGE